MFILNGHTKDDYFDQELINFVDLCNKMEKILVRPASSYQTWYEIFISPDEGEYWYFSNPKRGYAISIKWYESVVGR